MCTMYASNFSLEKGIIRFITYLEFNLKSSQIKLTVNLSLITISVARLRSRMKQIFEYLLLKIYKQIFIKSKFSKINILL